MSLVVIVFLYNICTFKADVGLTAMAGGEAEELPAGWKKKESRTKPGRFYYANLETGASVWKLQDVFKAEKEAALINKSTSQQALKEKPKTSCDHETPNRKTGVNSSMKNVKQLPVNNSFALPTNEGYKSYDSKIRCVGDKIKSHRKTQRSSPGRSKSTMLRESNKCQTPGNGDLHQTIDELNVISGKSEKLTEQSTAITSEKLVENQSVTNHRSMQKKNDVGK